MPSDGIVDSGWSFSSSLLYIIIIIFKIYNVLAFMALDVTMLCSWSSSKV